MAEVAVPLLIMPELAMCDAKHRTGRAGGSYTVKQARTCGGHPYQL